MTTLTSLFIYSSDSYLEIHLHYVYNNVPCDIFILKYLSFVQEVKAAIFEDMVRLGKEGGLKSFEQVKHWLIIQLRFGISFPVHY